MTTCLVTGGAGFIGSNLVDKLIDNNYKVIIVDNLSTGFEKNVNPKAIFINTDINNTEDIESIFKNHNIDYVFHLAAQIDVRKSTIDPVFDANTNILASIKLIALAKKYQTKKFIYISTGGAVYGNPQYIPADENHPVNPLCPYGISKHTVEHYLYYNSLEDNFNYTVLRLPNVYGPRQNPEGEAGVVSIFINTLLKNKTPILYGHGKATRDYVYVGDVVEAIQLAIATADREIINIGWGKETSVQEILDTICNDLNIKVTPVYEPLRPGEVKAIALKAEKAKEILNWQPKTTLSEGIHQTVLWAKT